MPCCRSLAGPRCSVSTSRSRSSARRISRSTSSTCSAPWRCCCLYYALLATLRLIYRSLRRIAARLRPGRQPSGPRAIPLLGRLRFPTLFVSAVLAAASVLYYDGLTLNLLFMAVIVALLGIVHRPRGEPAPSAADR